MPAGRTVPGTAAHEPGHAGSGASGSGPSGPGPLTATGDDAPPWLLHLAEERVDLAGSVLDECLEPLGVDADDRAHMRELVEGVWWSGGEGDGGRRHTEEVVARCVRAAAGTETAPLLALYIRVVCETAWDLTWDHGPMRGVLTAARAAWPLGTAGGEERLAVEAMSLLTEELALESAVATSDPGHVATAAGRARRSLDAAGADAESLPPGPVQAHLLDLLTDRRRYVAAVETAAVAARDVLAGGPDDLDRAIEALREAERHFAAQPDGEPGDHGSLSELRAHRSSLERLVDARTDEWLRVDEGTVMALYPFGLRHDDQAQVVSLVKEHADGWSLGSVTLDNSPTGLLLVDDVWRGEDPLRRRFEGTQLDLPDLLLTDPEGEELLRAEVSLVLSQLGNHYLRVVMPLERCRPDRIGALVWMAAPEYGDLTELGHRWRLEGADGGGWGRLSDVATTVLADLTAQLTRCPGLDGVTLSFRPGMYHVVTTVRQASVLPGGRDDEARVLDDAPRLPHLFGAEPVCHPVPPGVGAVVSWSRYAAPAGTRVVTPALTDEYLLVSVNHTLLASFSSPDYMVATLGQAAEFVASLEGMFAAWQDELSHFHLELAPHLSRLDVLSRGADVKAQDYDTVLHDLERRQLRLRKFLTSARVSLLFISSPALVTSPVMRETITRLLDLNRVWGQRTDFTEAAGQALADRLSDLIETWSRRREEEREQRNRLRIDTLLAVVAGIGISGVLALVQAGYGMRAYGSTVLALMVLVLAGLVGYLSYRFSRSGDPARRSARAGGRRSRWRRRERAET